MGRLVVLLSLLCIFSISTSAQEISGKSKPLKVTFGAQPEAKPVITWISPETEVSTAEDNKGYLKVGVTSANELKNVTLYFNNLPMSNERGLGVVKAEDAQFDEVFERNFTLQVGDNEIKIVAEDLRGNVIMESRVVNFAGAELMARNDYALLFATDNYDDWPDLTNPINDAKTIAKELEEVYGFQVELVTNPNRRDVLGKLREYAQKSYLENDQLFIFIAGHGQFDPFFNAGYLVCKDSRKADEVKESYLAHSNLRDIVNNIPSRHTFLAIDACFGGTIDPTIAKAGHRGNDDIYSELTAQEYIQRKLRYQTRKYLTSGGKEYVPDGKPGRHSPFAAKILEALRNYGGNDKIITLPEMMVYLEKINPEPRTGSFGDDEPGSDFVFVAK